VLLTTLQHLQFDFIAKSHNPKRASTAANGTYSEVQEMVATSESALLSHLGNLSGSNKNEYFAKGYMETALANYQQRKAVRTEASALGMSGDMASKFATKEAFDDYLKSQKKSSAA